MDILVVVVGIGIVLVRGMNNCMISYNVFESVGFVFLVGCCCFCCCILVEFRNGPMEFWDAAR